jgi:hypothetical protein
MVVLLLKIAGMPGRAADEFTSRLPSAPRIIED